MRQDHRSIAVKTAELPGSGTATRQDADYVFYELTRSICPICRTTIDAQIVLHHEKVFMRKRCPAVLLELDANSRLLAAEIMTRIRQLELPDGVDFETAKRVARSAAAAVFAGSLGYTLIIAHAQ
jgi:hypothetical protein